MSEGSAVWAQPRGMSSLCVGCRVAIAKMRALRATVGGNGSSGTQLQLIKWSWKEHRGNMPYNTRQH
jgi:hypothetical protein